MCIDDQLTDDRPLTFERFKWPYLCKAWSDLLHVCTATILMILCPQMLRHTAQCASHRCWH